MANAKVGGEIDGYCTKCRLTLAHTILAMVGTKVARVRCNTCGGEHTLRAAPGVSSPKAKTASTSKKAPREKAEKVVVAFEQRIAEKDPASARAYSPRAQYAEGELLQHPTFGLGIVTAIRNDKIDVDFKASQKTLVHGRGEAPAAHPTFQGFKTQPAEALRSDAEPTEEAPPSEPGDADLPAEAGPA